MEKSRDRRRIDEVGGEQRTNPAFDLWRVISNRAASDEGCLATRRAGQV
jgi:hypothetical protein